MIMKLVRRPGLGVNPDLEVGRFLTKHAPQVSTPRVAGYIEYHSRQHQPMTLAILQEYIANEGSAWNYTIDSLTSYLEGVLSRPVGELGAAAVPEQPVTDLAQRDPPALAAEMMGSYLQSAELLGRRTGELHAALATATDDSAFAPEPFTPFYQRAIYQGMRGTVAHVFPLLRKRRGQLPDELRELADGVLAGESRLLERFHSVVDQRISGMRIRTHGDYHLGQVLYTGKDFVIIDFEGEPSRPLSERRLKRSPLRDVAGLMRSFHYAAYSALLEQAAIGLVKPPRLKEVEGWALYWHAWASAACLRGYLEAAAGASILPQTQEEIQTLLDAYVLEKAVYEVGYELNTRPDWVRIPLTGIAQLLGVSS
jgi:maltose alpha-D-glucosyltransferase/alpha-amylase